MNMDYMDVLEEMVNAREEELIAENEELKQRIDKAIEYIENDLQSFLYSIEYKTLLEILRGDE